MNCCMEQFSEMLSFIFKREIKLKMHGEPEEGNKRKVEIDAGENFRFYFETDETDEKIIAEIKEGVEKILKFEAKKQEEQMLKQAKENFVNDVVHFRFDNIDSMLSRSEILDFDFYIKRTAIILEIQDMYILFKDKNELILQQLKEELYDMVYDVFRNEKDIISYAGSNRFVICKAEDEDIHQKIEIFHDKFKEKIDVKVKLAIGDSYDLPGIEGMGYSYRDAEKYLSAGKKFLPSEDIYRFNNVGIFLVMSNLPKFEKEKLAKYTKQLMDYDAKNRCGIKEFLDRLFINNLAIIKTEEELGIAKNKGKNMISAVKDITGLDPTKFEDAVKLYVSLKLLK